MPLEREGCILRHHAAAIIGHTDQVPTPAFHLDDDPAGAGIQRVLHQLLHDAGGALHHLTGGDLVRRPFIQYADDGHLKHPHDNEGAHRSGGRQLGVYFSFGFP